MHLQRITQRLWHSRQVRVAAVLLVVALSYAGLHALAATRADSLTLTVRTQPSILDATQTVTFSSTLTAAGPVKAAQAAVSSMPAIPLGANFNCPLPANPIYFIDVSFRWHGVLVETAHVDTTLGCTFWHVSILGLPDLRGHDDSDAAAFCTLQRVTGMPSPPAWENACVTWMSHAQAASSIL